MTRTWRRREIEGFQWRSVHIPAGEAEAVDEYESDPDEVKYSLVMGRMEASDDKEEEDKEFERRMNRRVHIHSYDESDGQGGVQLSMVRLMMKKMTEN